MGTFWGPRKAQFSEVEKLFFRGDGKFLRIRLADYEADPAGFEQIWESYLNARRGKAGTRVLDERVSRFAWQTEQPNPRRELGIAYRYHLSLQTNIPAADSLFQEVLSHISFQSFPQ